MSLPGSKGVTIRIAHEILDRIDPLQPSHLTRKAFVNQLILEAIELREAKLYQLLQLQAK